MTISLLLWSFLTSFAKKQQHNNSVAEIALNKANTVPFSISGTKGRCLECEGSIAILNC